MRSPIWRAIVTGSSMEPALLPGDHVLLARPARRGRSVRVRAGKIVAARQPGAESLLLIKRAILAEPDGWLLDSDNPGAGRAGGAVDSWRFGAVPASQIEGRLLCRYWPPRRQRRKTATKSDPGGKGLEDPPRPDQGT